MATQDSGNWQTPSEIRAAARAGQWTGQTSGLAPGFAQANLVFLPQQLAAEFLLPVVQAELERRALPWNARATRVILAQHGVDACVMGGVATVIHAILLEPGKYTVPSR